MTANLALKGRRRVTPAVRGECGSRGRGCHPRSRAAPGQNARPARRPACGLITPAALGRPGVGNAHPYLVPSQEARELELSGGVRSLPQVPWWNAGRRARPKRKGGASRLLRGAPCAPLAYRSWNTASAGVPLPFFYFVIARSGATKQSRTSPLHWIASLRSQRRRSTSLFDITRARNARARPGSYCIRARDNGGGG